MSFCKTIATEGEARHLKPDHPSSRKSENSLYKARLSKLLLASDKSFPGERFKERDNLPVDLSNRGLY